MTKKEADVSCLECEAPREGASPSDGRTVRERMFPKKGERLLRTPEVALLSLGAMRLGALIALAATLLSMLARVATF
jgi:hypothetical protein